jgi:hypothetical protein
LVDKWVVGIQVDFTCTDCIGVDGSHVTEVVQDVEAIICEAESVYVLEI